MEASWLLPFFEEPGAVGLELAPLVLLEGCPGDLVALLPLLLGPGICKNSLPLAAGSGLVGKGIQRAGDRRG